MVLEGLLRLLHPIAPFITEEIWQKIRPRYVASCKENGGAEECGGFLRSMKNESIMISEWLDKTDKRWINEQAETEMRLLQQVIYSIRNIRGEMNIQPGEAISVTIASQNERQLDLLRKHKRHFEALTKLKSLEFVEVAQEKKFASVASVEDVRIVVDMPEELREREIARLKKELGRIEKDETRLAQKVESEKFRSRAPREVVDQEFLRLQRLRDQKRQIMEKLDSLE
jgi:valyl-tRNA synthetase